MLMPPATGWKPRTYQSKGVALGVSQACLGLLFGPGLGKTSVVYAIVTILKRMGLLPGKVLVICPLRPAFLVWPWQKDKYLEFAGLRVCVLHGKDKDKLLASDDFDLYVLNPEGLGWLTDAHVEIKTVTRGGKTVQQKELVFSDQRLQMLRTKFHMLVVDESTKFKSPSSLRFKILKKVVPLFKRRMILTGTVAPKGLLDLFGQIYILDEGASLGQYITHYRNKYFYPSGFGGYDFKPQADAPERIAAAIAPLTYRVPAEGNLELPEVLNHDIWVDLPKDVIPLYKKMERDMIIRLQKETIIAANAAVASSKCRQIANGAIYENGDAGKWQQVHDAKIEALEDLIEQLQGTPVLVTYEFSFDRDRIAAKLKIPCISTGNVRNDNLVIGQFARGELPAVMGNPASISLGIDGLQENCCNIAMFGLTWNLQDYLQVIDRVRRVGGKSRNVVLHRILTRATVDERVLEVLDDRTATQNSFMELLESLRP